MNSFSGTRRPSRFLRSALAIAVGASITPIGRPVSLSEASAEVSITGLLPSPRPTSVPIVRKRLGAWANKPLTPLDLPKLRRLTNGAPLIEAEVKPGGVIAITHVHREMPRDHVEAFASALAGNVAKEAARLGRVKLFILHAKNDGQSFFDPETQVIEIGLNDGFGVATQVNYDVHVMHESAHAIDSIWDNTLTEGREGPKRLQSQTHRVKSMCQKITGNSLNSYLNANAPELERVLRGTASSVEGIAKTNRELGANMRRSAIRGARVMRAAASGLKSRREQILKDVSTYGCHMPSFEHVLELAAGQESLSSEAQDSPIWNFAALNAKLFYPLRNLKHRYYVRTSAPFGCLTDGRALGAVSTTYNPDLMGHPWDFPAEVAATQSVVRTIAPNYYEQCMNRLHGKHPEVFKYIHEVGKLSVDATPSFERSLQRDQKDYVSAFNR